MADIHSRLDGATNVLLEEPPIGAGRETCTSLLVDGAAEPNVVFVTFTRQARECVDQLDGVAVGKIGVITVGNSPSLDDESVTTESVSTPSDLTGLGIGVGRFLSEFDTPLLICFDSLTAMLQYVDVETAYEFLHAITGQVHAAGARAHFHIDPSAHDDHDVAALTSLFDARVSLTDDDREIDTRDLLESPSHS
ncbi:MAG: DUF7504 family protein [Natrialbaceae archaeon]